jgi:hypothetical protein
MPARLDENSHVILQQIVQKLQTLVQLLVNSYYMHCLIILVQKRDSEEKLRL